MNPRLVAVLRTMILASALAIALAVVGGPETPVARATACPPVNTWLGPPNINRFADGNCGSYVNGLVIPFTQNNVTISTVNLSGTIVEEANVVVDSGGLLTTAAATQWTDATSSTQTGEIEAAGGDIEFGAGTTIQVSGGSSPGKISASGGTLNFNGTPAQPITITSANGTPAPGDWGRVEYDAGSSGSMSFTNLSFAGGSVLENGCGSCVFATGILVTGGNPLIGNVTVSSSAGNGIEYTTLTNDVAALTLTNNAGFAAYFDSTNVDLSNFVVTASGNTHNDIGISGNVNQTNGATGTWNNAGIPIFPQGNIVTANLNVGPGVTIVLNQKNAIFDPGGFLNFNGTQSQPITITSANATPAPGDWGRVEYDGGSSGSMSFTNLSFAGAPILESGCGSCVYSTDILVAGGSPTIGNVNVTNGLGNGVEVAASDPTITALTTTNNTGFAVFYDQASADLSQISVAAATGNGFNDLGVGGGRGATGTWNNPGIPIFPQGSISTSNLNVGPGVTILLNGGSEIVDGGSALNFNGTASQPITITSANASPASGDWERIEFDGGSSGTISFTTLKFAGAPGLESGCGSCFYSTGILVAGGNVDLNSVTISNNLGNGAEFIGGNLAISGGTFTNNQDAAVRYDVLSDLSNVANLRASGNGQNALSMQAGSTSSSLTWPGLGIPIAITGGDVGVFGGTFTLGPGVTVELNGGESLHLAGSSTALAAIGTQAKRITITSANTQPKAGDWGAVRLDSGATGKLAFTDLLFGGAPVSGYTPSELILDGVSPTIQNNVFLDSAGNDVLVVNNGQPTLAFNWLLGVPGGFFGISNGGSTALTATRDFWGSPTGPTSPNNPGGTGTAVSANVTFSPWLGLTIKPTSGAPGSLATVSGTGYQPGETVLILWNCSLFSCVHPTFLRAATADANGSFGVLVRIPTNAPANRSVPIGGLGRSSQAFVQTTFTPT